ncbi:MAG: fatty acid desaturase [Rhizobacter sp.]|nr:fatty acid desaturase [Rhizobacter sp.]
MITTDDDADSVSGTPSPHESNSSWREQARGVVSDLFKRSPTVYWADLLLSAAVAWTSTAVYFVAPAWSALQIVAFMVAGVFFFRAGTFIHEIVHMPSGQMVWFKRVWNLLLGIPLLMPWILYRNHTEHHNHKNFGTPLDGEYLPLAASPLWETVKYLAQAPLLPLFMVARFGILGPVSWLHPWLREWVLVNVSAAVSNPYYRKRFPKRDEAHLKTVEVLCFAYLVAIAVLVGAGVFSMTQVMMAYLLLAFTLGLNWVRNLAAHRYANEGGQMTMDEQVADTINITGQTWLTVALFPVGLRYHALHHMFPALPYHAMGEAHRRLMLSLPADAPYRATDCPSFFTAVRELWQSAKRTSHGQSAMRVWPPKSSRP